MYGLNESDPPNAIYNVIGAFLINSGEGTNLKILKPNGSSISNAWVNIAKSSGNLKLKTNSAGLISFTCNGGESVSISSGSADLSFSLSYTASSDKKIVTRTITATILNYVEYKSSKTDISFSGACTRVDVSCGGAGGGGGVGYFDYDSTATFYYGNGGNGGLVDIKTNCLFQPGNIYSCIVGSGGSAGGGKGGLSKFLNASAFGGDGGLDARYSQPSSAGGTGGKGEKTRKNGGATGSAEPGQDGSQQIYSGFSTTKLYGGGGGGYYSSGGTQYKSGGAPGGGNGGYNTYPGDATKGVDYYGGGGGGGANSNSDRNRAAVGGSGIVCVRMHH